MQPSWGGVGGDDLNEGLTYWSQIRRAYQTENERVREMVRGVERERQRERESVRERRKR